MLLKARKRTLILGTVAFLLVGATVYDYTTGISPKREAKSNLTSGTVPNRESAAAPSRLQPKHEAPRSRIADLVRESDELKYFLAHAPEIRSRYQTIAVPYAEAVATFATLYNPGESPQAVAKKRVTGLLPAGVNVSALLISESAPNDKGAVWLTATLSFSSKDSVAFETAVLALGDPTHGTLWKELEIRSDPEARTLSATGKLLALMVEQSE